MTNSPNPWIDMVPGIRRRTLTTGATMYQMLAELKAGSHLPEHHHSQEQISHVLSGRLIMITGGARHELAPGESFYLASNVPHAVDTVEDAVVLDTFSPPRTDYLAVDAAAKSA